MIAYCEEHLDESPLLYYTLTTIFKSLADEYDDQAITTERYNQITSSLTHLVIESIENPTILTLEKLIIAFKELK